jgi:hypothetical protein
MLCPELPLPDRKILAETILGLDLPKTMAERTVKEHRHRQFLDAHNAPPKSDKVQ